MVMLAVVFVHLGLRGHRTGHYFRRLASAALVAGAGLLLVLTSSILRGYGGGNVDSPVDALLTVPEYITSATFINGAVDNLELAYYTGAQVTSMYLADRGEVQVFPAQSFVKIATLPIPREQFSWKPQSVIALYSATIIPQGAAHGASLPVPFASEMYVNFGLFGMFATVLVVAALNSVTGSQMRRGRSYNVASAAAITALSFVLIRGSGPELYALYVAMALASIFLSRVTLASLKSGFQSPDASRFARL
jgi:hypothetical protein